MTNTKGIEPTDIKLIEQELNENTFVRKVNKGNNEVYIVNYHNAPNVIREIGRLRELTFALAGGGTGKEIDIDDFDTSENCYQQLIVYDREEKVIAGGYRFIDCATVVNGTSDNLALSTRNYFNFTDKFITEYLPYTIELGRSWIHPDFQSGNNARKGMFALDNLWDGLGAVVVNHPHMKYFFGKVTMYANYNSEARNALLYFMSIYCPDNDNMVTPIYPLMFDSDLSEIRNGLAGLNFDDGIKVLNKYLKEFGENVPPLINSYMRLSPTMKSFGTAVNPDFGGVEETGILVAVADVYPEKKERHLEY